MNRLLSKETITAAPGFNRWLVPPAALAIHLCIGQAYAISVFNLPLSRAIGITGSAPGDWTLTTLGWIYTLAIVFLGLSAAFAGKWLEEAGPRKVGVVAACCWGGGFLVAALGVHLHWIGLVYLGYGVIGGCGLGLGYVSPVSTLIRWFPDRRGMATGMAIMGFGGGAMIAAPLSDALMRRFASPTSVGVRETFVVLGLAYFGAMLCGAVGFRLPPPGWQPAGWSPPAREEDLVTRRHVHVDQALRAPQFYLLWGVLCLNVTAGIGVLGQASPMIQEVFRGAVGPSAAAGFVGLLSLFNIGGRLFWASGSDTLGRKTTYAIFFGVGVLLYAAVPLTGRIGSVALFVACLCVILTMYGGGFATIPAYLADVFGTRFVGAIHGRLLTAWSVAGVLGPVLVNYIRQYQIDHGVAKAVAYDMTMYIMAGLLLIGFACNLAIRRVSEHLYMPDRPRHVESGDPTATRAAAAATLAVAGAAAPAGAGTRAIVVGAWILVGAPLAWGAWSTVTKALLLFERGPSIQAVEGAYQEARFLKDQIDVTRSRGATRSARGVPLAELLAQYRQARARLQASLPAAPVSGTQGDDERALQAVCRALENDLGEEADDDGTAAEAVDCAYDARALAAGRDGPKILTERMYACFGAAAGRIPFDDQMLDRLTVFSLLPLTDDRRTRRRLFLSLDPVWRSINADNGPGSPYRQLIRMSAARLAESHSSIEAKVESLGIDPRAIEGWLVSVLEAWRETTPGPPLEPWDFAHAAGRMSRALSRRVPREDLRTINDRFYADLGADPRILGIQFDLDPWPGKDPVAFTTFGARPRLEQGEWRPGEPWVFASYRVGGVDNLAELLHETGHAVHIAAIRARPALMDWPDSDTFTEAIADLAVLEMYEPAWQRRHLEGSVPLADALRAKYSGIVMDTAWALFEIRMHRDPGRDPNRLWTEIASRYLKIRAHPERSWWAMRGQLINLPGYMLNYAAGAILVADLRARVRELRGPFTEGDPGFYEWVSERLYRFGLERPSRQVIEDFLGRPVSPRALLDDMRRARRPARRGP